MKGSQPQRGRPGRSASSTTCATRESARAHSPSRAAPSRPRCAHKALDKAEARAWQLGVEAPRPLAGLRLRLGLGKARASRHAGVARELEHHLLRAALAHRQRAAVGDAERACARRVSASRARLKLRAQRRAPCANGAGSIVATADCLRQPPPPGASECSTTRSPAAMMVSRFCTSPSASLPCCSACESLARSRGSPGKVKAIFVAMRPSKAARCRPLERTGSAQWRVYRKGDFGHRAATCHAARRQLDASQAARSAFQAQRAGKATPQPKCSAQRARAASCSRRALCAGGALAHCARAATLVVWCRSG